MNISVKAKVILQIDNRPYYCGNVLYMIIRYKFDKHIFYEDSCRIDLIDDGTHAWVWDEISRSEIMPVSEFISKCKETMSDMEGLESKIKEKVIYEVTVKNKGKLEDNNLTELAKSIHNTKIEFKFDI